MSQQGRLVDFTSGLETLTGNTGGAISANASGNISILGSGTVTITGNPGTNTLTVTDTGTVATTYTSDSGNATPAANILNTLGGIGLTSSASGNTLTYDLDIPVTVSHGGTGLITITDGAILIGNGTSAIDLVGPLTDGQLLIGNTGTVTPTAATLTSSGSTITITNGAGSINLETDASVATSYSCDVGNAIPALGILTVSGGTLLASSGAGSTVTLNADDTVVASVVSDAGSAVPASNAFSILGTGGITTSAATSVITIDGSAITTFTWNEETGTSASMVADNGYIANNAGLVTFTLPATATIGDSFKVTGLGAGGWSIAQNASQLIHIINTSTTIGIGGSLSSTLQFDSVELVCVATNTTFNAIASMGNLTVV